MTSCPQLFDVKLERTLDSILPPRYTVEIRSSGLEGLEESTGPGVTTVNAETNGTPK